MPSLEGMPVSIKGIAYGAGGNFRVARRFVPQASQTAGILWGFRNASSSLLVVLNRVTLSVLQVGAPTAAIEDRFSLIRARSYTVDDTTGSAAITPAANEQKLRSTSANSAVVIRESTAAGGATGGTSTLDTNPMYTGSLWVPIALQTASIEPPTVIFQSDSDTHPLVLQQNEGFQIKNDNALGTASGIVLYLNLDWAEVSTY